MVVVVVIVVIASEVPTVPAPAHADMPRSGAWRELGMAFRIDMVSTVRSMPDPRQQIHLQPMSLARARTGRDGINAGSES